MAVLGVKFICLSTFSFVAVNQGRESNKLGVVPISFSNQGEEVNERTSDYHFNVS